MLDTNKRCLPMPRSSSEGRGRGGLSGRSWCLADLLRQFGGARGDALLGRPGQSCIIALNCLFARLPYPAWVETDQADTEIAIISGDVYRELYLAEPALQHFTFATLSTRLFELMTLLQGPHRLVSNNVLRRFF
jgi:CRP-like cAMP-binding protein